MPVQRQAKVTNVNIKDLPVSLWAQVKVLAIQRRVTVKAIVVKALREYLELREKP